MSDSYPFQNSKSFVTDLQASGRVAIRLHADLAGLRTLVAASSQNFEIAAVQKCAHLAELEKCCQTHIFLQKFVLIQPRTSPPNICKILQKKNYQNLIANLIVILLIRTSKPISPDSSTSPQVPAHDRPPQQLLRPGARARRGGGPGRGRAGAAKDTNE